MASISKHWDLMVYNSFLFDWLSWKANWKSQCIEQQFLDNFIAQHSPHYWPKNSPEWFSCHQNSNIFLVIQYNKYLQIHHLMRKIRLRLVKIHFLTLEVWSIWLNIFEIPFFATYSRRTTVFNATCWLRQQPQQGNWAMHYHQSEYIHEGTDQFVWLMAMHCIPMSMTVILISERQWQQW